MKESHLPTAGTTPCPFIPNRVPVFGNGLVAGGYRVRQVGEVYVRIAP
jgi:hypothetical protein